MFSLILCCLSIRAYSDPPLDSLKKIFRHLDTPQQKLKVLGEINQLLCHQSSTEMIKYVLQMLKIAQKEKDTIYIAKSYEYLGMMHQHQKDYRKAEYFYKNYLIIIKKLLKDELNAKGYYRLATIYADQRDFTKGLKYFERSLALFEKLKDENHILKTSVDIGLMYYHKKDYKRALFFLMKTLKRTKAQKDSVYMATSSEAIARIYFALEDHQNAFLYIENARRMWQRQGKKKKLLRTLKNYGEMYKKSQEYPKAIEVFTKGLALAIELKETKEAGEFYEHLFNCYQLNNQREKSLRCYALFKKYQDSVQSAQQHIQVNYLASRYQQEVQKNEIEELKKERQNYLVQIYIVLFLWVLTTLLLVFWFFKKNNENQRLRKKWEQESEVSIQKLKAKNKYLEKLNQEKNMLIHTVSHDLKAPLNRVYGLAELVSAEEKLLSEECQKYLHLISQVVYDARIMVQNWLDIRSIEEEKLSVNITIINMGDLLLNLLTSYKEQATKKGIKVYFQNLAENIMMRSDVNFLNRIMDNLVSNAIKFSPKNRSVYVRLQEKGENMYIEVEDKGIGISEEDKKKLFQKFQKLSAKPTAGETSTGLGLSIVKVLVEQLHGEIIVKSVMGEGTVFQVIIPKIYKKMSS